MNKSRWTLIHTDHTKKQQLRYVVRCDWYKWGDHETVSGDCNLPVGKVLVWNGMPAKPEDFVDIWVSDGDYLFVTEGSGKDRTSQGFSIESAATEILDTQLPVASRPQTIAEK